MVFIPTYLYIKQHSITGKLYFGKTTKNLNTMIKYLGSGKHWIRHYNKHGRKHVITLWYQIYDNIFDLVADSLSMSKSFDIVNNKSWLNIIDENGLSGGSLAGKVGIPKSKAHRDKLKISATTRVTYQYKLNMSNSTSQYYDVISPNGIILENITLSQLSIAFNLNRNSISWATNPKRIKIDGSFSYANFKLYLN